MQIENDIAAKVGAVANGGAESNNSAWRKLVTGGAIAENLRCLGSKVIFSSMVQRLFTGVSASAVPLADGTADALLENAVSNGGARSVAVACGDFLRNIKLGDFGQFLVPSIPGKFVVAGGIAAISLLILSPRVRGIFFSCLKSIIRFAIKLPIRVPILVLRFGIAIVKKLLGFMFKTTLLMAVASFAATIALKNRQGLVSLLLMQILERAFPLFCMGAVASGVPFVALHLVSKCLACVTNI
ncbi:MAG: hypothetical protein LBB18_04385 [Puniceicoccales bacterium]|nr:hypothetical protein [Puniceicoccales bacterium]